MMNAFVSSSDNREMSLPDQPLRVLIVDDHEIFRHGLRDLINSIEGFQVVAEAGSCKNALALAEQRPIDLVVLDMYLPDGDVIDVTRQLRQQIIPPPRVLMLSAVIYDDTLVDAILAGAQGYLTKDMPASEIVNALNGFRRGELALLPAAVSNLVQMLVQKYSEAEAELSTQVHNGIIMTDIPVSHKEKLPNTATRILTPQEAKV